MGGDAGRAGLGLPWGVRSSKLELPLPESRDKKAKEKVSKEQGTEKFGMSRGLKRGWQAPLTTNHRPRAGVTHSSEGCKEGQGIRKAHFQN